MKITEIIEAGEPTNPGRRGFLKGAGAAAAAALPGNKLAAALAKSGAPAAKLGGFIPLLKATIDLGNELFADLEFDDEQEPTTIDIDHLSQEQKDIIKDLLNTGDSENLWFPDLEFMNFAISPRGVPYMRMGDASQMSSYLIWEQSPGKYGHAEMSYDSYSGSAGANPYSVDEIPAGVSEEHRELANAYLDASGTSEDSTDVLSKVVDILKFGRKGVDSGEFVKKSAEPQAKMRDKSLDTSHMSTAADIATKAVTPTQPPAVPIFIRNMVNKLLNLEQEKRVPVEKDITPQKQQPLALPAPEINAHDIIQQTKNRLDYNPNAEERAYIRWAVDEKNKQLRGEE